MCTVSVGSTTTAVSTTVWRALTDATTSATTSPGMSCGMTASPPRRATVSAIRRPETAVMLATTTGIVVPVPSTVDRSTSNRDATSERDGDEEDVAVGEVGGRHVAGQETHGHQSTNARPPPAWPGDRRRTAAGRRPERGRARAYSFTAPVVVFMIRRWKTKNSTATGMVMIAAAPSLSGNWLPWPRPPAASSATPLVSGVSWVTAPRR